MGIHYVQYRARWKDGTGVNFTYRNWWRVYRDGRGWDPTSGVYYYATKQEAMNAVANRERNDKVEADAIRPTTRCLNCGAILTDADGNRLQSANFDSDLPTHLVPWGGPLRHVTWARCDVCYNAATGKDMR